MTGRRLLVVLGAAALVGVYGVRAFDAVRAGERFERARTLYSARDYALAAPLFDAAAIGALRLRAKRLASESRLELWQSEVGHDGGLAADPAPLVAAAEGFLACRCVAPASRRSWEGLGEVYDEMERKGREARSLAPFDPAVTGWRRVGRPGRISIGMFRSALALAPNWYSLLDDLALTFWAYGLDGEARETVRAAAVSLPLFDAHRLRRDPETPRWILETFAEASREAIGRIPLLARATHLTDLGKLELELGDPARAEQTLRAAQELRNDALQRAEIEFHLGLAALALGRESEARERFLKASENEAFLPAALGQLAHVAERAGDLATAVGYLRRLRQEDPRNLDYCLNFARVARALGDGPAVMEALRWARLIHPADSRAYFALAEVHLDKGDAPTAAALLREIETVFENEAAATEVLRRRIARAD